MTKLRSAEEVSRIRDSAVLVADTLEHLRGRIRPGVTTAELDKSADTFIRDHGGVPSFLGYLGYPAHICVSVNEEVVHGIPGSRMLEDGDIVGLDVGVVMNGYHGDAAITAPVGQVSEDVLRLLKVTEESLLCGIDNFRPGKRLGDVGHAIQEHAERHGYGVVRSLVGHGIGEKLHEDPQVPNYGKPGTGQKLRAGMVCAIEPMITVGGWEVETLADQWTIVTRDRSLAAHFEHTVALTEDGPEILSVAGGRAGASTGAPDNGGRQS
jgi:methionyl aminopeptidase